MIFDVPQLVLNLKLEHHIRESLVNHKFKQWPTSRSLMLPIVKNALRVDHRHVGVFFGVHLRRILGLLKR